VDDQFMALTLQMNKQASVEKGAELLKRARSELFQPKTLYDPFRITFSILIEMINQEAAFQLAERLNDNQTIDMLLDMVKSGHGNLAVSSVKCLQNQSPQQ
jgi:hypothetical protein